MATKAKHVLIADDEQLVQKTFKFCLEEAGYEVGLARDGREALRYVQMHKPAIVLLDVFMPDCDGLETLLEIKRRAPATKVIVMSGGGIKNRYEFLSMASKLGADGIIRKPLSPRALIALLQSASSRTASHRPQIVRS
jgi:CheY-like chemotaxis protein